MTTKRQIDQDPDYESIPAGVCPEQKRLRRIEQDARENTIKKIEKILRSQFGHERKNKHEEMHIIDEKIEEVRLKLDRLRALVVMKQYSTSKDQPVNSPPSIHPTTKTFLGKAPAHHKSQDKSTHNSLPETKVPIVEPIFSEIKFAESLSSISESNNVKVSATSVRNSSEMYDNSRTSRFKTKLSIVVGNISKYIPADNRDKDDQATHKWMVYVRGSRENPHIDQAIKKVRFFLHSSYRPNDLVEVCYPPFHLSRRGWGEFPVRVQLHFHNHLNKPVDIIHNLKLDKTYTGLQTLGAETAVDLWLYMKEAKQKTAPVHNGEVTYSHVENSTSTKTTAVNPCHKNILSNSKVFDIDASKVKVINRSNGLCTNEIAHRLGNVKTEPALSESVEQNTMNSSIKKSPKNINKTKSVVVIVQQGVKKEAIKQIFPHSCIEKKLIESSLEKQPSAVPLQPHLSQPSHASSPSSLVQGENSVDKNRVTVCTDKIVKQGDAKPSTHNSLNGLTTFVKCVDGQGRLLLVPQSTVVKFPNSSSIKHELPGTHNSPQTNLSHIPLSIHNSKQSAEIQKANLPLQKGQKSYVVKVIPNHTGNLNQVILIPTNSANKEKEVSLKFSCSSSLQSSNCKSTGSNKVLDKAAAIEHLISMKNSAKIMKRDDTDSLNKKLSSIRLEHYDTIHELTNQVVKLFPLIQKDVDRSCHPYCAPSAEVFFSWNVGKQRAAEWQRAKGVRQAILKLLEEKSSSFSAKDVWSTKTIMVWCYKTGYTLRKDSLSCKPVTSSADDLPSGTHHFGVFKDVSTISEVGPLLETLEEQQSFHHVEDTEEEVDIVSIENDHASIASKRTVKETHLPKNPTHNSSSLWIPESPCVEFVRDAASQIGIKFQPCELATNVFGHVVEEMILAVCREYITDLLRASLFQGFERMAGNRYPEVIQVEDIFTAIQKLPLFDLLTNKYIGTPPIIEKKEVSNSQIK